MRGDIQSYGWLPPGTGGSPPRARGHPQTEYLEIPDLGLTPACAGTSSVRHGVGLDPGAHPRVRGDIVADVTRDGLLVGSPPRARGHPWCASEGGLAVGAHPRVRGDIGSRSKLRMRSGGSPLCVNLR